MSDATRNPDFAALWANMKIKDEHLLDARSAALHLVKGRPQYETVQAKTGVPWWWTGIVHSLEAGLKFDCHLHNGDSLRRRTVHVPAGRPKAAPEDGTCYTWEESACDALAEKGLASAPGESRDWSIVPALKRLELYNGTGYHSKGIYSPYLWSFSNHYSAGKYVSDGTYDHLAVSSQCGGAVLLRCLIDMGHVSEAELQSDTLPVEREHNDGAGSDVAAPDGVRFAIPAADPPQDEPGTAQADIPAGVLYRVGSPVSEAVRAIQRRLNYLGYGERRINEDGDYGVRTRSAVLDFQAENNLATDGKVGVDTWHALMGASAKCFPPPKVAEKGIEGARAEGHPEVVAADAQKTAAQIVAGASLWAGADSAGLFDVMEKIGKGADLASHIAGAIGGFLKYGAHVVFPIAGGVVAFLLWRRYGAYIAALKWSWWRPDNAA